MLNCNNSTYCISGCQFFEIIVINSEDNNIINEQKKPKVNSTIVYPTERNHLNITFWWPNIISNNDVIESIYMILVVVRNNKKQEKKSLLGLVRTNTFCLLEKNVCDSFNLNTYKDNGLQFQLVVYPINYNGYNESIRLYSNFTDFRNLGSFTNLSVVGPSYNTKTNYIRLWWTLFWDCPKDMENTCVGKYGCFIKSCFETQSLKVKQLSHCIKGDMVENLSEFHFDNYQDPSDRLSTCKLSLEVFRTYGQCSVGKMTTIPVSYPGCAKIPGYEPRYCSYLNISTTPGTATSPISTGTKIIIKRNITELYYVKTNNRNIPFYKVTVSWYKISAKNQKHGYLITYFQSPLCPDTLVNNYSIASLNTSDDSFQNESSFSIGGVNPGWCFGYFIYAYNFIEGMDQNNFKPHDRFNYFLILVPVPLTELLDKTSKLAEILIPTLVVFTLVIVIAVWRVRRTKKKSELPIWNNDHYAVEDYMKLKSEADDWEINPESIDFDKKVGEGAFGTVFIAKVLGSILSKYASQHSGAALFDIKEDSVVNVAVKLLKDGANQSEFDDFREEINLMKEIGYHKNIVNMIGCSTIKKPLCLIVEYMVNGDLLHFLRNRRTKFCVKKTCKSTTSFNIEVFDDLYFEGKQNQDLTNEEQNESIIKNDEVLTPNDLFSFAWQVASGMEYLSRTKLVHRDLAARNVLVGAEKNLKISDFGLTRKVNDELNYMSKKSRRLPIKWMSVEAIFDQMFTSYSDVWAYGVVLFEIFTLGGTPYPTLSNRELLSLLKTGYRMDRPESCSELIYNIMLQCWNEDPLQRPTFEKLAGHFEELLSESGNYITFEIDHNKNYYNVASFNSVASEAGDNVLVEEVL